VCARKGFGSAACYRRGMEEVGWRRHSRCRMLDGRPSLLLRDSMHAVCALHKGFGFWCASSSGPCPVELTLDQGWRRAQTMIY